jgi:hypothetical protein
MSSSPQLSPAAFARAAAFMHGSRPLDRALFAFHFENAPALDALRALAAFQNPDGGFHGLEADTGFDFSTVLSTCRALHLLHELHTDATHPLVSRALDYLLATYDAPRDAWPIIPSHDNSRPHAPWWHCSDDFAANWGGYIDNPRPDALAGLHLFTCARTDALRKHVSSLTEERLRTHDGPMEMHGLACYLRLHGALGLDDALKAALGARLPAWIDAAIERDPAKWSGYGLRPLDVVPTADSPWLPLVAQAAERQLDHLIETQAPDGSWHPYWNWGDAFPEAWPTAKLKWQAVLTLANLSTLRSYGRLPC